MGDLFDIHENDIPWAPSGLEDSYVLSRHGQLPLSGVLTVNGNHYFFWCLDGEVSRGNLWAYILVGEDSISWIQQGQEPSYVIERLLDHLPKIRVALAESGRITRTFDLSAASWDELEDEAHRGLTAQENDLLEVV